MVGRATAGVRCTYRRERCNRLKSSQAPNTCRRSCPWAPINTSVGVPCIWYARIVHGIGLCSNAKRAPADMLVTIAQFDDVDIQYVLTGPYVSDVSGITETLRSLRAFSTRTSCRAIRRC